MFELIVGLGHIKTLVPRVGLEPTRLAAPDFESGTSTNSITEAGAYTTKNLLRKVKRCKFNKNEVA